MNKLPDHFFISTADGGLYDTRKKDWSKQPPLRADYCHTFGHISTPAQVKATLRAGAYAWPGGYPLYFCTHDGCALCFDCARKEFRSVAGDYKGRRGTGWRIIACDINYEDAELQCTHCSGLIESAYGETAEEKEQQP